MDRPQLNTLSVCSGVGMLEQGVGLGLDYLGYGMRVVGYVERDAYAAACLRSRMEESSMEPAPIWCGDLAGLDCRAFRGLVDILCAGLPCQPYSCAGKQRGLADQRSYGDGDGPIPHFLRIVAECRPAVVFVENVPPWVSGGWFRPVGEELSRLGYALESPLFITAEAVGASHRRERVFILGHYTVLDGLGPRTQRDVDDDAMQSGRDDNSSGGEKADLGDPAVAEPHGEPSDVHGGECAGLSNAGRPSASMAGAANDESSGRGIFAPGPSADWQAIPEYLWSATEPRFRMLVDGVAVVLDEGRADQLRCGGNGVVAIQAAVAFVELMRRIIP